MLKLVRLEIGRIYLNDTDMSSESAELQAIATAVWTTAAKNAQKAVNEATI